LLPPRPMVCTHYLCVWPSLVARLGRAIKVTATATLKSFHQCCQKSAPRYAKVNKCSPNSFTHIYLYENISCSCFSCLYYNTLVWMFSLEVHP
jgi:hypothetical protein